MLGYYHAESRFDAADMHPAAKRVADRLSERQAPGAPPFFVALLDSQRLARFSREGGAEQPLLLLLREGGKAGAWKRVADGGGGGIGLSGGGGIDALRARWLNLHAAGRHRLLVDFDEHLDDVSADYTNPGLLGADTALLAR